MAEDREILREVWEGRIPVSFSLSPDEIVNEQPDPFFYYLLVPRLSYFPLVTDKVQKYFQKFLDAEIQGEFWLEFEGQPLKWHYPVGVLFDLYGSEENLPWKLTVHFQNFPKDELLHCPNKDAVEAHFMSMVKEADALKHRSQVINGMQKKDHKQLWLGLLNDKFDQFWSVNRKLMESGEEKFKYIPYKIYLSDGSFSQQLFKPIDENGTVHLLSDLMQQALPDFNGDETKLKPQVFIQGIEVPWETPILWLCEHLSYPDNFLHICVHQ
ncbi:autophagy protein 5 [Octopus bimaculoides]|uniref:Autophagy protein 5 n=1 Tax=Octopus bimaculoides TaxID=37653 RepID=A0A0L8GJY4_OCTBM|nr:autophagy protein 5 [Octopus bimaculoides]|eukprot:XP_014780325.1 PREDICTED: autophagy protein 5-like [Octopus bimaculoides]